MKKRSLLLLIILIILFVIFTKYNGAAKSFLLDIINPLKVTYQKITNISDSYIVQQRKILELEEENNKLKQTLIKQSVLMNQLTEIYKVLPSLEKKPYKNIYIVDTISYVKLNKLNEILLTTPKNFKFKKNKPYGFLQNDVAAGIALYDDGKLYGYLLSNPKCRFSVKIGKYEVNGVAQGDNKDGMVIKYIPRWSKISIGDKVVTSGLDNIFYPNVTVGTVTDIKLLDRYKEARVNVAANLSKPSVFFLIAEAKPYLTTNYIPKTSFPNKVYPFVPIDSNISIDNNETTQTKENIVEPEYMNEQEYLKLFNSDIIWQNPLKFDQ